MNIFLFFISVVLLIIGHSIRVKRWNNLLPCDKESLRSVQFSALSVGYLVNFFIPFKIGEILRAGAYSFWGKKSFVTSVASVIFERLIDLIVWSIVISVFFVLYSDFDKSSLAPDHLMKITFVAALIALTLIYYIQKSKKIRIRLNKIFAIFNDDISFALRHLFWTLGETSERFYKAKKEFVVNTVMMWAAYLCSYYLLAQSIQFPGSDILSSLFNNPLSSTASLVMNNTSINDVLSISLFFLSPIVFILIYSFIKDKFSYQPKKIKSWFSNSSLSLPNKKDFFASREQYQLFLLHSFRTNADIISEFYMYGLQDGAILHRIFHGGSDALTTLVSNDEHLAVRKFASSRGREKLRAQKQWLLDNRSLLPLTDVSGECVGQNVYTYDMPYSTDSIDFYEYIHSADIEDSWHYLEQVLNRVSDFHSATLDKDAQNDTIKRYIHEKVVKNFLCVKSLAPLFFYSESIIINGTQINVREIESWLLSDEFVNNFQHKHTAIIHGDLTIENIIINKDTKLGWFIIDPNVGNLFESPLIDFAKLMQSLHLGYESLNRSIECQISDVEVSVNFYRSLQYAKLSDKYENWLRNKYSDQYLKEVYLHEIIHYLRLVPYKFRRDNHIGMAFTACMLLLIDKFIKEYK